MSLKDNASLALIPAAYKTSKVYSAIPTNGNGDFTFSRSGSATRINKAGLVETMGTNVPRLNYDLTNGTPASCPSLLLEPSRLNYTGYSAQFDNSYWTKATSDSTPNPTVTANAGVSPDGGLNADRVQATAAPNNSWAVVKRDGINTGATVGSKLQQSLYLKAYDSSQVGKNVDIYMYDFSNTIYKTVYKYTLTADWQRVVVEHTISGGNTSTNIQFAFGKARNTVGGSLQSETATDFLVWGGQLEKGNHQTSYIPTATAAAVTRTVDWARITSGLENILNTSVGTLFFDLTVSSTDLMRISISDSSSGNDYVMLELNGGNFKPTVRSNSGYNSPTLKAATVGERIKIAFTYSSNQIRMTYDGNAPTTTSITYAPIDTFDRFNFSLFTGNTHNWQGKIHQAIYFNTALTDAELQTLTS